VRRLVLLRHGRTAYNHGLRIQGQLDVDLDDTGRAQAELAGPAMAALDPVLLWSSDLARARDTAAYVEKATGLAASYDERLRETHLGERQGLTHAEYAAAAPEEFAEFRRGRYDAVPGAEPTSAVRARMVAVLSDLLEALAPGETAVAVSHGAAIRVAVGGLLGWPDEQFHTLRGLDNCGWVVLTEHPDVDGLRLAAYNRVAPPPDFTSATSVG
jgi:glucosyl-3-phosphoglycerate phosphatase